MKKNDKTFAVVGKKIYGNTLNSAATSKASVPKRSTNSAVGKRPSAANESKTRRSSGFERVTVREIRVSMRVVGGSSVRSAGGRKTEDIEGGRESRTVL
ncbi:hypothetical protein Bca52824_053536 [Brassica carinata]|uniref:Uncharacterized protein n=1 Tax=Brassica carinata TaxID=52824 RepID=A0A8X7ULT4_BRACI|nr:hypothetical protein Bca52824_053536 [Brassica carinata]